MPTETLFPRPTSVLLCGPSRPLLNWTAYALAASTDPGFIWTDIRPPGESLDAIDPLARGLIPSERLNIVHPTEILPERSGAPAAARSVAPSSPTVRRLQDFVRLPLHTQRLLTGEPTRGRPIVLVLSNAQRMVGLYPAQNVAPVVKAIVEAGVILLVTFADVPPEGHEAFDLVLRLEGGDPTNWSRATLKVEKAPADGLLRAGAALRLGEFAPIAPVLTAVLGSPPRGSDGAPPGARDPHDSAGRARSARRT